MSQSKEEDSPGAPLCIESMSQKEHSGNFGRENNNRFSILIRRKQQRVTQDGKWAWIALVAASLVQFTVMGIHNSFGVVYSQILEEFKWRKSISAFIGSAAVGVNFLICPIGTQLCESFSPQMVTIVGGVISVSGLLGSSFVSKDYAMFLSYSVVWGIGSSLCYSSTYVVVGKLFHKHLAIAMGIVTAGSGLGQLAMGPSIESMLERFGWKVTMRTLSGLAVCLILAAFTYREPIVPQERVSVKGNWRKLFDCSLWCVPGFLVLTISLGIFNFGYYIPIIHVPNYAKEMGFSEKKSWLISFMAVPSVIARLVFGKLAEHPRVNRLMMFQACLGMMALSTILCPFVSTEYVGFVIYMIIFGTGEGCIVGTAPTLTAHIVGKARISPALGLLFFSFAGPLTAGPFFAGWLYDETNRYREAFFVAGGTMALCFLLLSFIHRFLKQTSAEFPTDIHTTNNRSVDQNVPLHHVSGSEVVPGDPNDTNCSGTEELPLYPLHVTSV